MKALLLMLLIGCAYHPVLKKGSCYKVVLQDYSDISKLMDLGSFKVINIHEFNGRLRYAIKPIGSTGTAHEDAEYFDTSIGEYSKELIEANSSVCLGTRE